VKERIERDIQECRAISTSRRNGFAVRSAHYAVRSVDFGPRQTPVRSRSARDMQAMVRKLL
jgi:hypothetical protein